MGAPDRPAIAYVGDGAWGMSLNEILTCVRYFDRIKTVMWQHFLLCCLNEGEFPRHSCRLSASVVVNIHTIAIVLNLFF